MYFNNHTHTSSPTSTEIVEIINLFPSKSLELDKDKFYSIGIHPSHIDNNNISDQLKLVETLMKLDNVIAVGEIGLDRNSDVSFNIQKEVFEKQLSIAEKYNKPVIVHCVKAYSEILHYRKQSTCAWIMHGFRGKDELAEQLLKKNIYLSFGEAITYPASITLITTLKNMPSDKLFLETDTSNTSIKEIYKTAAKIRKTTVEYIIKDISKNVLDVFSNIFN